MSDSSVAVSRLQHELVDLMRDDTADAGFSAFPEDDNMFLWVATVMGAEGSVYGGIEFRLRISFPEEYPFKPPTVKFVTPCYHPNVSLTTGDVCLDILKENWSAVLSVRSILLSLQSLLLTPNNNSPLNADAAKLWDKKLSFRRRVVEVANCGAAPSA